METPYNKEVKDILYSLESVITPDSYSKISPKAPEPVNTKGKGPLDSLMDMIKKMPNGEK